jgi:2-hydroxychromene-2-carboxylate isomerase
MRRKHVLYFFSFASWYSALADSRIDELVSDTGDDRIDFLLEELRGA